MPRFVPRERKHKVLARAKKKQVDKDDGLFKVDTNAIEIVPQHVSDRDRTGYGHSGANGKVLGKKKKRLDKYIVRILVFYYASYPKYFDMYRLQN